MFAGLGTVPFDIGYGGAFYALVDAGSIGLDLETTPLDRLVEAADSITRAVAATVPLDHPDDPDLAFLYGTILTDGGDGSDGRPSRNVCVFAEREVDRSPTGSGVSARMAVQVARGLTAVERAPAIREPDRRGVFREGRQCGKSRTLRRGARRGRRAGLLLRPLQLFHGAGRPSRRRLPAALIAHLAGSAPQSRCLVAGPLHIFCIAAAIGVNAFGRLFQYAVRKGREKVPVVQRRKASCPHIARAP